ncbi:hypothetical protein SAMN05216222_4955 [Pseudomonas prosekii]|uniref:Uncharacterized protein n=1 Tax=Pseudomonas prosekii TaxID=1148509 RepID=A0A1H2B619_9PSED|nr:hypothetical protein SAMN05216222_4955 [Pseudomonas prosekii]
MAVHQSHLHHLTHRFASKLGSYRFCVRHKPRSHRGMCLALQHALSLIQPLTQKLDKRLHRPRALAVLRVYRG